MNLIWFILVLRAHDSYSSSDIILEIIMPQKKNFEMQENYKSLTMLNDLCARGCLCFFFLQITGLIFGVFSSRQAKYQVGQKSSGLIFG